MFRRVGLRLFLGFYLLAWGCQVARAEDPASLAHRPWFEARSRHFHTYSYGPTQEVARLTARLEQFHDAYAALAGAQSVASPPISVLAFPDHPALEPFLPRYHDKPANLAGFFHRTSDENLIVMSLSSEGQGALETILHEYAHLLLRRNENIWPMWLTEGMADIYATFQVVGEHTVRIGQPRELYLHLLGEQPMLPLHELFQVTTESPAYNERERQGVFYAESWLLTHYLMRGVSPQLRGRFGDLTRLLRQGQGPEEAFTNSFPVSLAQMDAALRRYLQQEKFEPQLLNVQAALLAPQPLAYRGLSPVETLFRLGEELLRVRQQDAAAHYFQAAREVAPASPLPYEGLGLLAAEQDKHEAAIDYFRQALERGPLTFLVHYVYARELVRRTATADGSISRLTPADAEAVRLELQRSLALMPEYAPAHHLLGTLELIQGDNPQAADAQLQQAIQLEPENLSYALTLARMQLLRHQWAEAQRSLAPLCRPNVDSRIRSRARELLDQMNGGDGKAGEPAEPGAAR